MDRLTSMAVFVRAADLGSFAAAAAALEMSAPMVGKHVRFLEERTGAQLISRTTRRQSLTEFGRAYYERCRAVLTEADSADALASQFAEPRGRLRVTMPVHFGRHCVTPVLLDLAQRYPALEFDLSFSDRLVDLADGDYDLAIRTGDLADNASLVTRRLARQRMTVCAAPSYLEEHGRPRCVEDLGGHRGLVYRRSGPVPPWLLPRGEEPVLEFKPDHRFRLDDLDALADVAAAGMGIAWLPYWLVRDRIEGGRLVELLPLDTGFLYDVHALWPKTPQMLMKVRIAIDALAAALPKYMT